MVDLSPGAFLRAEAELDFDPPLVFAEACEAPADVFPNDAHTRNNAVYRMAVGIEGLDPSSPEFERISNADLDAIEAQVVGYIEANYGLANQYLQEIPGYSMTNSNLEHLAIGKPILGTSPDLFNPARDRRNIGAFGEQIQAVASSVVAGQDVDYETAGDALTATRDRLIEATTAKFEAVRELRRDPAYTGCEGIETAGLETPDTTGFTGIGGPGVTTTTTA